MCILLVLFLRRTLNNIHANYKRILDYHGVVEDKGNWIDHEIFRKENRMALLWQLKDLGIAPNFLV